MSANHILFGTHVSNHVLFGGLRLTDAAGCLNSRSFIPQTPVPDGRQYWARVISAPMPHSKPMAATSGISTIPKNMQTRKITGARININSTKATLALLAFRSDNGS
jgi:hypothetical protein